MMKSDMWTGTLFKSKHEWIKLREKLTPGLFTNYQEIILLVTSLLGVWIRVGTEDTENKVGFLKLQKILVPLNPAKYLLT